MTSPLPLPDWIPWWVHVAVLVAALLFGLAFLMVPFAVFGVKGRLELLEARLDEIQGEIRSLSLRLPEAVGESAPGYGARDPYVPARPPIPPAPRERAQSPGSSRTEPRLY